MSFSISVRSNDEEKHLDDVTTLAFHKDKLYSGSDDGKIKVWTKDLALKGQIDAHEGSVFHVVIGDGVLYSCSNDGTTRSWALDTLAQTKLLHRSQESEIWRLTFVDGLLYAGDDKGTVRVFRNDMMVYVLNVVEAVKGMMVINNQFFVVRDLDLVICKFLEVEKDKYSIEQTIMGRAPVTSVAGKIFLSSRSGRDILVNDNSKETRFRQIDEVKDAHEMIINALHSIKIDSDIFLYSGGWDKVVKEWKLDGENLKLLNTCNVDMVINTIEAGPKGEIYVGGSGGNIVRTD